MVNSAIDKELKDKLFPLTKITIRPEYVSIETFLRRLHTDGKWYLQEFWRQYSTDFIGQYDFQWLQNFYGEIYNNLILGTVVPEYINAEHGYPVFLLDENQEPEYDRLKKALNLGLNLKTKTEDENRQD